MEPDVQDIPHVEGEVGLPKAPGAAEVQRLLDAGFTSQEIQAWKDEQTQTYLKGGFTPSEIDAYWGEKDPGIARMRQTFDANMELIPAEERAKVATNTAEYFQAGLDYSATSLLFQPQEHVLPEDAGLWAKVVAASGQIIGDLPPAFAGYFIGSSAGGAAGSPFGPTGTTVGSVLGGNFGAGAAPELMRQTAIVMRRERTANGDFRPLTWREVMARTTEIATAATKAGVISMVGGSTGRYVGSTASKLGANKIVAGGAELGSAALAMTATAAALDGRIPDDKEFVEAAAIMVVQALGLKAVGVTVGATRRFVASKRTEEVKANLEDIYVRTGLPPDIMMHQARTNPALMQEILAPRAADGTETTPSANGLAIDSVDPYYRPKLKIEEQKSEAPKPVEGAEPTPEMKLDAQVTAQLPIVKGLENSPDKGGVPQVSPKGAIGPYQIMPGTAKYYGLDPTRLGEPAYNEMAARAVLKDLNEKFDGNLVDILVAYNAGPGRAKAWIKGGRKMDDLPLETQRYLERAEAKGWLDTDFIDTRIDQAMTTLDGDWVPPGGKPPGPPRPPGAGTPDEPPMLPGGPGLRMNADMATEILLDRIGNPEQQPGWRNARDMVRYIWNSMGRETEAATVVDESFARAGLKLTAEQMTVEDMVRQTYASRDRASYFIRKGTIEPINFERRSDDNYILGYKQVKEDGGNLDQFIAWRMAQRYIEKAHQGIDVGLPWRAVEELTRGKDAAKLEKMYRRGATTIQRVKDAAVDYYQESGRLSKEQAQRMKDLNREHIVLRRIFDPTYVPKPFRGSQKFTSKATLKAMKGSDRMIVDPVMADIDNIHFMVAMADMNRAIGDIVGRVEFLQKQGASDETLPITKADADSARLEDKYMTVQANIDGKNMKGFVLDQNGKEIPISKEAEKIMDDIVADRELRSDLKANQFIYWRDGKPEVWEAKNPALIKLLNVRFPTRENPIAAALTIVARMARAGVVFNPNFPIRSALLGELAKTTTEQYKTLPLKDLTNGALELITNRKIGSDWYDRWIREGGGGATLAELERKYMAKDMEKLLEETGTERALANAFRHPLEAFESLSMWIDTAGRLGTYKRLVNERQLPGPKAAMISRKVHLDHAEHLAETWADNLSRWVIFSRSVIKDLESLGEAIKRDKMGTAAALVAFVTLPTVINWFVNKLIDQTIPDDEARRRYSEQPVYNRENYYVLPEVAGVRAKISRTYTGGYLFGSMVEKALDAAWENQVLQVSDLWDAVNRWILPSVIPNALLPVEENRTGRDSLSNKPVVPASLEGNAPWMQYGPATTETAKKLAVWLGQPGVLPDSLTMNPSPIWLEEYFKAWTGTMPLSAIRVVESATVKPARPWEIADVPFVGAFFARTPTTDAASISKFYDDMEDVTTSQDDFRLAMKRGNIEEAQFSLSRMALVKVTKVADTLRNQADLIRRIDADPDMTADEKRGFIDKLTNMMILTAKTGSAYIDADRRAREERDSE